MTCYIGKEYTLKLIFLSFVFLQLYCKVHAASNSDVDDEKPQNDGSTMSGKNTEQELAIDASKMIRITNSYIGYDKTQNDEKLHEEKCGLQRKQDDLLQRQEEILKLKDTLLTKEIENLRQEIVLKDKEHAFQLREFQNLKAEIYSMKMNLNTANQNMMTSQYNNITKLEDDRKYEELKRQIEEIRSENVKLTIDNKLQQANYPVYTSTPGVRLLKPIIYAINCGGEAHIDSNGIYYIKDPRDGPSPVYGWYQNHPIGRIQPQDYALYRIIRFNSNTFGYDIPIKEDGNYVLVLKFITDQHGRTFHVVFNKFHKILQDFNIYAKATAGTAHDEYFPFSVKDGNLSYKKEKSVIYGNKIPVEFVHKQVNAIIAAIFVMKGDLEDVPKLPPVYYPSPDTSKSP